MTDKQLIDKIISLLVENPDKLDFEDGDNQLLSLHLFKPVKEESLHDYIYAYEIIVELAETKVIIQIVEKLFNGRADMTGKTWPVNDTPVDLIILNDNEEYHKFRKIFALAEADEKKKVERKRNAVIKQFLTDQLTFDNPIDTLIKLSEKRSAAEKGGAAMPEPKIMDFSKEKED